MDASKPINAKLVMARADVEAVLKKYDIAGVVILQNREGTDVALHLTPTYASARMKGPNFQCVMPDEPSYMVPPSIADRARDAMRKRERIFDTVNMVVNLGLVAANVLVALRQAEAHARKFFNLQPPPNGQAKKIIT